MKSLAMLNFKNISPPRADFYSKLDTINKNILYVTHQTDKILKIVNKIVIDRNLQDTVDKYFSEDSENIPEVEDGNRHSD